MTKTNRGKNFESVIKKAFDKIPGMSVIRLKDPQSGYAGECNICDFIMYKYPYQYCIECKSCYGNTLPFTNITDNQIYGLTQQSKIPGIVAGVIVWFIDHDKTIFIPIESILNRKALGEKSWNIVKHTDDDFIEIPGKKLRVFFDYDITNLVDRSNEYANSTL